MSTKNGTVKARQTKQADPVTEAVETGRAVILEAPIHTCHPGYATNRIEIVCSPRQAAAAKVLWCSLSEDGRRYRGGRSSHPQGTTVDTAPNGILWLLDQLADAIEDETGKSLTTDYQLHFG